MMFVEKVGIIGAGAMGSLIAEIMAFNNLEVVMKDIDQECLDKGMKNIKNAVDEALEFHLNRADNEIERIENYGLELTEEQKEPIRKYLKPKVDEARAERIMSRIKPTLSYDDFEDVDIVIEAAVENMEIKKKIFKELEDATPRHVVLATNTSALPVTELAASCERPHKIIGMHFFNPPHTLPLIEVIPGIQTSAMTVEEVIEWAQTLRNHRFNMVPIKVKECPGFLVNRILGAMLDEAFCCYEEGIASPADIDIAIKSGLGHPMGPLELADFVGIDILYHTQKNIQDKYGDLGKRKPIIVSKLYDAGYWGKKAGRGFFEYTEEEEDEEEEELMWGV